MSRGFVWRVVAPALPHETAPGASESADRRRVRGRAREPGHRCLPPRGTSSGCCPTAGRPRRVAASCSPGGSRRSRVCPTLWRRRSARAARLPCAPTRDARAADARLGYRDCESIAIWCATGDFESFQVKRFMGWKARLITPIVAYALHRKPRVGAPLAVVSSVVTLLTALPYIHSRAIFDHTRVYPGFGKWERGSVAHPGPA
jgi:hypothetical protein